MSSKVAKKRKQEEASILDDTLVEEVENTNVDNVKERRKWTPTEIEKLLGNLISIVSVGKEIEKPNAVAFYKRGVEILAFEHCNHNQLKNQVKNLKRKHGETVQWRNQTGQGVLEDQGESSFKETLLKRCPHFEKLDEIFGNKLNIAPPYLHDSSKIGDEDHVIITLNTPDWTLNSTIFSEETSVPESSEHSVTVEETQQSKLVRKRKLAPQTGSSMLERCVEIRIELQKEQLALEKEKWQYEKIRNDERYDLEVKKMEQDREIEERKLDLEQQRINKDFELQKYKIEQEFKLKLELSKVQTK